MADQAVQKLQGDLVSQLIQTVAQQRGFHEIRWEGRGNADIFNLIRYAQSLKAERDEVFQALAHINQHPKVQALMKADSEFHATFAAHILRAHACIEMRRQVV